MGPKHHWKVSCSIKKIWYCCELDLEFLLLTSRVLGARVPSAPSPWPDPGTWPLLTLYPAIAAGPSLPPFFSPLHCCNKTSIMLHLPNKPPSPSCWVISQQNTARSHRRFLEIAMGGVVGAALCWLRAGFPCFPFTHPLPRLFLFLFLSDE